jgi:peptidoglycan/LPS O-acetylase OafA/YrhL
MKGFAIILIIIHHLRVHTIENSSELLFFYDFGITGVAIFLILSGFGISKSIESKGMKFFFYKRLIRLYIPYVLSMVLEVFLNHIILHRKTNLIIELGKIVVVAGIDRNMWFIVFILLWYCMLYLTFKLGVATINKLFILTFISLIIITTPQLGVAWKINAFSFPLGCLLGLNSNFLKKLKSINSCRSEILCIIICSLFSLHRVFILSPINHYITLILEL